MLSSDQRVVGAADHYVYPDLTVACGALEIRTHDVLANPTHERLKSFLARIEMKKH